MSDEAPPQPRTLQLPAMTDRALLEDMAREVRGMRADLGLVSNDLGLLKHRVSIIEGLRNEDAIRASKLSGGVRGLSQSDDGQNMQIASLAVKVDQLAASTATKDEVTILLSSQTTAILARFDTVVKDPKVQMLGAAIVAAITTWLATKGISVPK